MYHTGWKPPRWAAGLLLSCLGLSPFAILSPAIAQQPTAPAAAAPSEDPVAEQLKSDRALLKEAKIAEEPKAFEQFFRARMVPDADRAKIQSLIQQLGNESFDQRELAAAALEKIGLVTAGQLRQAESVPDPEINRRAARILVNLGPIPTGSVIAAAARRFAAIAPRDATPLLLQYLPDADDDFLAEDLRSTLGSLATIDGQPNPVLMAALDDPLPARQHAALEALLTQPVTAKLVNLKQRADQEKNPVVRLRYILALVTGAQEPTAMPQMINLLGELPQEHTWRIEEILLQLAGEKGPKVSIDSTEDSKRKARDAWAEWWKANSSTVNLAKLKEQPGMLGLTMILSMDTNNSQGHIVELGPDKKEKWRIDDLKFPIAAQMVGRDRILVAEHNRHFVSLRDLKGKILWEKQVFMPVALQVMPNGTLFIAARNQIIELDRDREKQLVTIQRPQHDIVAAAKARNGEYIVVTNTGQLQRLNKTGEVSKSVSLDGRPNYYSTIQLLPNNRVLLTLQNMVAEFDLESGKKVWEANVNSPNSVQRLPNGNTLVSSMISMEVQEIDRNGKAVWTYKSPDNSRPWKAFRR
ncbi:outer membrane protein assembly factor BamB family protein [Tuwongella immobilis]|uniref:Pyrrolo-quinoline quinone: Uncharacterized protein n=1 Tax=Tuwongella immobilis TaxID=692036 RepID=A0A6C2YLH4_9BACT|nr:PQQ-binding-like beta-propeller repeat protein [Tuwongella immobilis]VIP01973.1 pyrrolo-quinoline quinone : Uncharacterized protein OS=Pirellula staleyi (strain ATCC 27377 / DSM 6068 / ICPB 4128) GN=Psta_2697 PE=4 SV=1 [Tuwongella immobilis]VTS00006.1 pyrrolo-quinoline quinone : Uncharacterized protein OS=Pirellula staleyi (strain ATCC 27377 / DSM 6068 / ICPB 4128) GN=Psta_2697 PE=4 SV=1 [Tuwongella immobilis]